MAKISDYKVAQPDGSDILIGTDVQTGQTKNFSVNAIGKIVKDSNVSWQFEIATEDIPEGSIYFENGGGNNTLFQNVTELMITPIMKNSTNSLPYLQSMVGEEIMIQNRNDLGQFGIFDLVSLTLDLASTNYRMELSFKQGSGGLQFKAYYSIQLDPVTNADKTFIYEQAVPSATWNVNHNLDKFPSVAVVDSANTTVEGGIEYIDENNLTLTFTGAFSGKAYLN